MANTWYVRVTGNDANAGTSAGSAFLTIGKAMTQASLAAGDTIYVGAGTYRISAAITPSSMASMTYLYGDTDGAKTGDAGEVVVSTYATNDTTAATAAHSFTLTNVTYWTIGKLTIINGANAQYAFNITGTSANITLQDLTIHGGGYGVVLISNTWGTVTNLTVERCRLFCLGGAFYFAAPANATGSDINLNVVVRNCVALSAYYVCQVSFAQNTKKSGGITFSNCELIGGDSTVGCVYTSGGSSGTYKAYVYNSLIVGWKGFAGANIADIVENYNVIVSNTPRTNTSAGANSISDASRMWRFSLGHEASFGAVTRPFGEFPAGSPLLGWGGTAVATDDINGVTRPASGAATTSAALGPFERSNSGVKDASVYNTAAPSLQISGPGYQDWEVPVAAAATTITAWVRRDANYTGTNPSISVLNGGEAGVADATATDTGAASTWNQLSIGPFTPTSAGIVTLRFRSSSTAATGLAWIDDFAVT